MKKQNAILLNTLIYLKSLAGRFGQSWVDIIVWQ